MVEKQSPKRASGRARRQATNARRAPRRHTAWIILGGAGLWGALSLAGAAGVWPTVAVAVGTGFLALLDRPTARKKRVGRPQAPQAAARVIEKTVAPGTPNAVREEYNTLPKPAKPPILRPAAVPLPVRAPQVVRMAPATPPPPSLARVSVEAPVVVDPPLPEITETHREIPITSRETPETFQEPTEAYQEPTEAYQEPTEESQEPTEEFQEPTETYQEPTEAYQEPTETFQEPTEAFQEPTEVFQEPTEAFREPTEAFQEVPITHPEIPQASQKIPESSQEDRATSRDVVENAYQLPSPAMLPVPVRNSTVSDDELIERGILLEATLRTFGVAAKVIEISPGPAVTRYELQPAPGVRVNKFTQLTDDIALALAAEDIRIEAPIPGKSAVGIEVPNKVRQMVPLREVLESPQFRNNPSKLTVAFGKDNAGNAVVGDLARMPHLLIAGSTGSGKSVCMNTIICSLLFKSTPDEVKMIMIDPKMVELSTYNGIPHLTAPVVIDVRKAAGYLKGAVKEMEARYELFAALGVRNVEQYNRMVAANPGDDPEHPRRPLPYIVIFIDELADLMMVAPSDVEDAICRLAQMARACGMHLVIATQSPRVDVITGLIKANVPSRIAFAVSSQIDSRVVMDSSGAERLLGRGDMLYHPSGLPKPVRAQGAFIDEGSVDELVRFVKVQGQPTFSAQEVAVDPDQRRGRGGQPEEAGSAADAAFPQAVRVVIEHGQASVSILQRRLRCNYSKAARLIDMMEERGFVGPHQGSKPRDVLVGMAQWEEEFGE
ncbi:MAG TPA: DNA translocase FtsK [Symbiobacteriaceae bacterium]|nr:DNA translocase FtsK [Symbiobacteriaceae bacterium]